MAMRKRHRVSLRDSCCDRKLYRRVARRQPRAAPRRKRIHGRQLPTIPRHGKMEDSPLIRRGLRLVTMAQYVYTMNRVGKVVPPKRQILKNISLSFFPGAKIGVLGLNGSGKS